MTHRFGKYSFSRRKIPFLIVGFFLVQLCAILLVVSFRHFTHSNLFQPVITTATTRDGSTSPPVMFIVRTCPKHYETRLTEVLQTYLSEVPINRFILVGNKAHNSTAPDRTKGILSTDDRVVHVIATDESTTSNAQNICADNHSDGVTCIEGRALFAAYERRRDFEWCFVVDDDVYVHRLNVEKLVRNMDADLPVVYTVPGCAPKVACATAAGGGICGGGGYLLSRKNLERIICNHSTACAENYKSREEQLTEWMSAWMGIGTEVAAQDGNWWSDITAGCVFHKRGGIRAQLLEGLYPWVLNATEIITKLTKEAPLAFHYVDREDMPGMSGLHKLVVGSNHEYLE